MMQYESISYNASVRRGFSLIELLVVVGIIAAMASIATPMYRRYKVKNDLYIATEQITQALGRAKLLSQSGQNDAQWGVRMSGSVLFQGTTYATRNAAFDESYPLPATIRTSGLSEVSFSRIEGVPSKSGAIILTSILNDQASITITLDTAGTAPSTGGGAGGGVPEGDKLTICHCTSTPPQVLRIPESAWPGHRQHGDYLGPCLPPPTYGCMGG